MSAPERDARKALSVEKAMEKVASLDFTMLKRKLELEDDWSAERVGETELLYRKYLALLLAYPGERLPPSVVIDTFWHAHILDTRAYVSDCEMLFGEYLHHHPYGALYTDVLDAAVGRAGYARTCELFREHFGLHLVSL